MLFNLIFLIVVYYPSPTSNNNLRCIQSPCQLRCISSFSYIKPQPFHHTCTASQVVYHPFPTSNHNSTKVHKHGYQLYIILFLHQTTTFLRLTYLENRCISSFSYIKPQLDQSLTCFHIVVYHPFPTSNHNQLRKRVLYVVVVYHPFPTSNHNSVTAFSYPGMLYIILFLHQTTTGFTLLCWEHWLYIILFPHQTTT